MMNRAKGNLYRTQRHGGSTDEYRCKWLSKKRVELHHVLERRTNDNFHTVDTDKSFIFKRFAMRAECRKNSERLVVGPENNRTRNSKIYLRLVQYLCDNNYDDR